MFTETELNNLITFLDRTPIKGHQERNEMNKIVIKIVTALNKPETEENKELLKCP